MKAVSGAPMPWFRFTRETPEALPIAESIRAKYQQFIYRADWPREAAAVFLHFEPNTGQTHFSSRLLLRKPSRF
jgi:hypothetical protein